MQFAAPLQMQHMSIGAEQLSAILDVPPEVRALAIILTPGGRARHDAAANRAARALLGAGVATLLVDLIDDSELRALSGQECDSLMTRRAREVIAWAAANPMLKGPALLLAGADCADLLARVLAGEPQPIGGVILIDAPRSLFDGLPGDLPRLELSSMGDEECPRAIAAWLSQRSGPNPAARC